MKLLKSKQYKQFVINTLTGLFILMSFSASANNRYINTDGQGIWVSDAGEPVVEVYIKGASVYAKLKAQSEKTKNVINLPATKLKKINSNLLNEYTEQFVLIRDFNKDNLMDVGVLKSVGYGSGDRCYSVFEYQPDFYSFSSRASKTICIQ